MITCLKRFSPKRSISSVASVRRDFSPESEDNELSSGELKEAVEAVKSNPNGSPVVWIVPDSDLTRSQSLLAKRRIEAKVFKIGRRSSGAINNSQPLADLLLPQGEPFTISRFHCELVIGTKSVVVRDLDSRFGILVNGVRLGERRSGRSEMKLRPGEYSLVIGPRDSEYRFRLIVE